MVEKSTLSSILYEYYPKRLNARFLAGLIPGGATKSEVNSVLYSNPSDFSVDTLYTWQLTSNAYEIVKLKKLQSHNVIKLKNQSSEKWEIMRLCFANGIRGKSYEKLSSLPLQEVEHRINEVKAFMEKGPLVSISLARAVLLDAEEFMNYKNTFGSNPSYKCTLECVFCTKNCILK